MSLRGVYYRVVSAGVIDKTEDAYKTVGRELLKLRRAGQVAYRDITDGTRLIRKSRSFDSVEEALEDTAASYRRALWSDQLDEVMVFTEKDAISGVLFPITDYWDVPLGVMRGYASETFAYAVAEEIAEANRCFRTVYLYQFGDHDPSGVNAWHNFEEKVSQFVIDMNFRLDAHFERLAVTAQQIIDLALPTRPTKKSDSRARDFAGESVEVDAVPPSILREIAYGAIEQHIDPHNLEITRICERSERDLLTRMAASIAGGSDDDENTPR